MSELKHRGVLTSKTAILTGSFYKEEEDEKPSSLIGKLAGGLYSYTIGAYWSNSEQTSTAENEEDPD